MKSLQGEIRVGVIGCGHWGKNYLRVFSGMTGVKLTALSDLDPAKRAAFQATYPGVATFSNVDRLLESGLCDAVVVASVASTHFEVVKKALEAGVDVLSEKPLTLNTAEAEDLCSIAARQKLILMVAHTFLFNPSIIQIKKYKNEGMLGDMYYVNARRTHLGLIREDVNAVWDLAPHDVSVFLHVLGEMPTKVQAMGRQMLRAGREDVAFINLEFPSGVIASIHVSWADSNKERFMNFVGSKCRIGFDDLNLQEPVRIYYKGISVEQNVESGSFGEFKYLYRDGDILSPKIPVQEPLRVLCEEFVSSVRSRTPHFSDGRFGVKVVDVLCRVEKALRGHNG